jgi:hypothetical protein
VKSRYLQSGKTRGMRETLLVGTLLGAALTIYGLLQAVLEARREYIDAQRRIEVMQRLGDEESAKHKVIMDQRYGMPDSHEPAVIARLDVETDALIAEYRAKYAAEDIIRPDMGNGAHLAAFESRRLLGLVLGSTRRDFIVAMIGVMVSTIASAASLYLA